MATQKLNGPTADGSIIATEVVPAGDPPSPTIP